MVKKYYAVKQGRKTGIYLTWSQAKEQIDGYSGAVYKSFKDLHEAEKYLINNDQHEDMAVDNKIGVSELNKKIEEQIDSLSDDEVIAFVDGSYNDQLKKSGYGTIIISKGRNKSVSYKAFTEQFSEELISLRNVAAELEGVKEALEVATNSNKKKITIYYDYEGIEKWATGEWKAKKNLTKKYVEFIKDKSRQIKIEFVKVPSHEGVYYNEEADSLAKMSLMAKGHKTYKDGSVYFTGYTIEDWFAIIDCIIEENKESLEQDKEIKITENKIDKVRSRLIINDTKNKVVVNLYNNNKSYVQGSQSVLFQKIIATAIEFLTNNQSVVETLNSYHALTIEKREVEEYFERLLPNYNGSYNDKIYFNLLSAVYNTMLTGYMPDYTCLVTPIFRAYEYCLHKILGEKMGLSTVRKDGSNIFSYFNKNEVGKYICNNDAIKILSQKQTDFLNKFYENYRLVRHSYSHWSADDYDTPMITEMSVAREYLKKGLILINEYYILF